MVIIQVVQYQVHSKVKCIMMVTISLLRLDTDWYESTKHELIHLFPRLSKNGVIIIDDYGHWKGCQKAVDEYFSENKINILLNRVNYSVRMGLKL